MKCEDCEGRGSIVELDDGCARSVPCPVCKGSGIHWSLRSSKTLRGVYHHKFNPWDKSKEYCYACANGYPKLKYSSP